MPPDPWRIDEWLKLPNVCAIAGCDAPSGIDQRGPLWLKDGSMHKLCIDHWEAVFRILGEQVTWEDDAHRSGPDRGFTWNNQGGRE